MSEERGSWSSPTEFLFSCLNYAIGLGNIWRFPFLVYRNGGGAFLIPFLIMLIVLGFPIQFLELAIGQYCGVGPNDAFKRLAPIFHGLGYCNLVVSSIVTIYYQMIVAWIVFYIAATFDSELQWGLCNHEYNSDYCYSEVENRKCIQHENETDWLTYWNNSCTSIRELCSEWGFTTTVNKSDYCVNDTDLIHLRTLLKRVPSTEEYYRDYAMGIRGATWENWGNLRWEMVLCLLLSYIVLYVCVIKGVRSSGKAAYFTTIFSTIILVVLQVRAATLEGASDGVEFYMTPDWSVLGDGAVWGDAASQTFYSLGIGFGSLVTLASYNNFNNNCHMNAIVVSVANAVYALFAGFVVFSILGFMANKLGVSVADVVQSGHGLAFVAYPEAVLHMPLPQLWAFIFFLMLFTLGIGSQFGGIEAINTAIIDHWPQLRNRRYLVVFGTCATCFLLGLPMCFQGGVYMFAVLDYNTATWAVFIIGFIEIIVVAWVYGVKKFVTNIQEMFPLSKYSQYFWLVTWSVLAPVTALFTFVFTLKDFVPAYFGNYIFPGWVDVLGYIIAVSTLLPLLIFAAYHILKGDEKGWQLFRPTKYWGPASKKTPEPSTSVEDTPTNKNESSVVYDNLAFSFP